jgi:hypothetical protein
MRNSVSEGKIARESRKIAPNSQEPRHSELQPLVIPNSQELVIPNQAEGPVRNLLFCRASRSLNVVIPTEADHRKAMICEVEGPVVSFLAHPSVEDFDPIRPKSKRRSPRPRLSENFSLFLEYQIDRGKPEIFQTL